MGIESDCCTKTLWFAAYVFVAICDHISQIMKIARYNYIIDIEFSIGIISQNVDGYSGYTNTPVSCHQDVQLSGVVQVPRRCPA